MSTFLQLCQTVRQECGVAGDGPSSVTAQTGILKKIVDRTARAWVDIQMSRPYWKFLRNELTFATAAGTAEYSVADSLLNTSVDKWDRNNSFIYTTSTDDESSLSWLTYDEFRSRYRTRASGRPTKIFEALAGRIGFETTPDAVYTVTLNYWMTPEKLTVNADVPSLPEHFHDIIVWKAVMMFAGHEGATDLYAYAKSMYNSMFMQLLVDQMETPPAAKAYPLARGNRSLTDPGFGSN